MPDTQGRNGSVRSNLTKLIGKVIFYLSLLIILTSGTVTFAQSIEITDPKVPAGTVFLTQGPIDLTVSATNDVKKLRVLVNQVNDAKVVLDSTRQEIDIDKREHSIPINVFKGQNTIRLIALKGSGLEPDPNITEISVTCSGKKCGATSQSGTAAGDGGGDGGSQQGSSAGHIKIRPLTSGTDPLETADVEPLIIVQSKSGINKLSVDVYNNGTLIYHKDGVPVENVPEAQIGLGKAKFKIAKGKNEIRVYDPLHLNDKAYEDLLVVTCGDKCEEAVAVATSGTTTPSKITINEPDTEGKPYQVQNISSLDAWVTVAKSDINKIEYEVMHGDSATRFGPTIVDATAKDAKQRVTLKFLRGRNTIRIYDYDNPGGSDSDSIIIECTGDNCASDFDVSTIVTNSQNTRILVGLEQAGGSSAASKTTPFLDFFFNSPFRFGKRWAETTDLLVDSEGDPILNSNGERQYIKRRVPATDLARFGFWGHIRLTNTPEQLTATGVFPSTLANQVAQSGTTGKLVQSFDFLAGAEVRLLDADGTFLSLIPNLRQRTTFSFAVGYGAISPLDATQENTKFFLIPGPSSPQRAAFVERFGLPKDVIVNSTTTVTPTHVAFVPLERDKFFKQWYAGFRLKTFYCDGEGEDCNRYRNSFPAITDVMVGQNELVTGGSRKRTTKEGEVRRAFVLKIDAFYPLPFRETRFIYLFGTAMLKLGGDVNVQTPLLLEPATSVPGINDPLIYIPPIEFLQRQQPNRDYYKIGIGINLTDLFNRNKPR